MKHTHFVSWLIIFGLLIPLYSNSQTPGKVSYISILESEDFKELESTLYFNGSESFFFVDMKSDDSATNKDEEIQLIDDTNLEFEFDFTSKRPTRHEVYINTDKQTILSQRSIFKNWSTTPCVVFEETGSINWEILDDSKQIGSFNTQKATTTFRGRDYTAWFTTEIPIGIGPWKFHGLPGLILEVQDDEMGVQFLFSSIQIPHDTNGKIVRPKEGEIISLSDFAKYQDNISKELIKAIKAKLPRNTPAPNISVKEIVKSIEREY